MRAMLLSYKFKKQEANIEYLAYKIDSYFLYFCSAIKILPKKAKATSPSNTVVVFCF